MKNWFEWKGARRLLSLALSIVMVLSLLPAGALAEEGEITPPSCSCEVLCAETVNAACPVCSKEGGQCSPVKEPEAQQGSELLTPEQCAHGNAPDTCEVCASEKKVAQVQALIDNLPEDVTAETRETVQSALSAVDTAKSDLTAEEQALLVMTRYTALTEKLAELEAQMSKCAHGNDPAACEGCASDARIASVQKLIDELPEDVTAETKEAVQSALSAADAAKSDLTEAEQAKLNLTRYTALTEKLASMELHTPAGDKVITAWTWKDEEEYLDEETGGLALPGASEEMPACFEDVLFFLPYEITATVDRAAETLTIDWVCEDYPKEGAYEGEYVFTALLPEGYALGEGVKALTVDVLLGGAAMYESGSWFYPTSLPTPTWTGTGTKDDPFIISTAQQLADLAYLVNKGIWKKVNGVDWYYRDQYYKLGADIDLDSQEWTPIGTYSSSKPFNGHFDGDGKTISNLKITTSNGALLGYVGKEAEIKNLKISNAAVQASGFAGVIAGNNNGTISECTVTIATIANSASSYVGAIAGYNTKNGTIDKCNVTGITMTLSGNDHRAGGIVGTNVGTVKNCTVGSSGDSSSITCTTTATSNVYIGGIVGDQSFSSASLDNCTNYAKVEAWANALGGIVGINGNSSVKNCKNYGAVISTWTDNQTSYAGGIVGQTNLLQEIAGQEVTGCENHGAVSGSAHQLGGIAGEVKGKLTNCKNTGTVNGTSYYVGGIAGRGEKANISDCTNEGAVTGDRSTIRVGGIVGAIESKISSITGCINYAAVTAADNEIGRAASYAGGIVGQARYTTTIEKCANVGDVTNRAYSTSTYNDDHCGTGGLIGSSSASGITVSNCYNVGKVTGVTTGSTTKAFVGGLVGRRYSGSLSLTSVYNAGVINTIGTKGAIIGSGSVTTANCSYWDGCGAAGTGTARGANAMTDDTSWASYLGLSTDIWTKTTNSGTMGYLPVLNTSNRQSSEPTLLRTMEDQVLALSGQPKDGEGNVLTTLPVGYKDFTLSVSGGIEGAAVTWSSSNPSVATIDTNGKVSIQGVGDVTITATKAGDATTNAASVSYAFSVTQTITNVTVSDLGEFINGGSPSFLASTQSDAPYHILDIVGIDASINPWDGTASGGSTSGSRFNVLWSTDGSYLKAGSNFETGKTYVGLFTLECDQYYNFAENLSFELNGVNIAPKITTTKDATHANWLDVKIEFTVKPVIETVSPSVVAPVKNEGPSTSVTLENGANYTAGEVTWSGSPSKFLGGTAYTATFTLTSDENHVFTTDTAVTVSGATTVAKTLNPDGTLTVEATFPATDAPIITSISVQTSPSKTAYTYGEDFDPSGLVLSATYDDGTTGDATYSAENTSAFTFTPKVLTVATTSVDVTYGEKTATISGITVSPLTIGIDWSNTNLTYNGTEQAPTAMATGLVHNDTITLSVDGAQKNVNPDSASSYTATVTAITGDAKDNYQLPSSLTQTFTISPKPVTVGGITADKTYDGTTTATLNYDAVVIDGAVEGDDLTVTTTATVSFTDASAGAKTVNISGLTLGGTSKDNYTLSSTTITVTATISPKPLSASDITVTLVGDAPVYGGTEKTQSVTVTFGETSLTEGTDYTLSGNTATAAGTHTLTVTAVDDSNYSGYTTKNWTITRAPITPVVTIADAVYGDALNPSITSGNPGNGAVIYTYYSDANCTTAVTPKNVGTYYVKATVAETANYQGATTANAVSFQITPKSVTVSGINAENKTFDGNTDAELVCTNAEFDGKLEDDSLTVTADGTFDRKDAGSRTVNITNLTLGGASKDNYVLATDGQQTTATASIFVLEIEKPAADSTVFTYTGSEQTYTLTTSVWYTITGDTQTAAGEHEVTIALKDKQNTQWKDGKTDDLTFPFVIAKAASSVTAPPTDAKSLYTSEPVPLVYTGTAAGGTMNYSLDGINWSEDIPTATDWKTYTVYYKVVGDQNHNDSAIASLTAEIVPFRIPSQPQPDGQNIDYGEDATLSVGLDTKVTEGISYQWCLVTVEGGKEIFTPMEGETGKKLTLTKPNAGKYVCACIITCGDYSETSGKATVTVKEVPQNLPTTDLPDGLWVEGGEKPLVGNSIDLKSPSSFLMTSYSYNAANTDVHQNYPTGMQVYSVQKDDLGQTVVAPVAELGNLLRYSGCSIRITGKPGIRMITSLTKEAKELLKQGKLADYTLEEYGTVVAWKNTLGDQPLTLSTGNSNYAYRKGVSDPVFANVGTLTQYTNVLVWDELEDAKYAEDIVMRPYIILSKDGETVTLYGGTVSRSIGYVAQQNANTFAKGTAGYKYVHDIIDKVNAINSSTGTNTTTGGNG